MSTASDFKSRFDALGPEPELGPARALLEEYRARSHASMTEPNTGANALPGSVMESMRFADGSLGICYIDRTGHPYDAWTAFPSS